MNPAALDPWSLRLREADYDPARLSAEERAALAEAVRAAVAREGPGHRPFLWTAAAGVLAASGDAEARRAFADRVLPAVDYAGALQGRAEASANYYSKEWELRLRYNFLLVRLWRALRGEAGGEADPDFLLGLLARLELAGRVVDVADEDAIRAETIALFEGLESALDVTRFLGGYRDEDAVLDLLGRAGRRRLLALLLDAFRAAEGDERAWILDVLPLLASEATAMEAVEIRAWALAEGALRTRARLYDDFPEVDRRRLLGVVEEAVRAFGEARRADVVEEAAALAKLLERLPKSVGARLLALAGEAMERAAPERVIGEAHASLAKFDGGGPLGDADFAALQRKGSLYALLQLRVEHEPEGALGPLLDRTLALFAADAASPSKLNAVDGLAPALARLAERLPEAADRIEGLVWSDFEALRHSAAALLGAPAPRPERAMRYFLRLLDGKGVSRGEQEDALRILLGLAGGEGKPRP